MKTKGYRHGEILLAKTDTLPDGLTKSKTNIFMVGSHGHNHSIDNGDLYLFDPKDDFSFGYLVANNTSLLHEEHSPNIGDAKIEDGIYKLIKQQEFTPEGLVPVID